MPFTYLILFNNIKRIVYQLSRITTCSCSCFDDIFYLKVIQVKRNFSLNAIINKNINLLFPDAALP